MRGKFQRANCCRRIILTVLLLSSCSPRAENVQQEELRFLESVTGASLCSSSDLMDAADISEILPVPNLAAGARADGADPFMSKFRRALVEGFDTPDRPCVSFQGSDAFLLPISRDRKLIKFSGTFTVQGRRLPVIVTRSAKSSLPDRSEDFNIVIRIGGGPGAADIFKFSDEFLPYDEGIIVIDLFYTGQSFNILHPYPSFGTAVSQVESVIRDVKSRVPKATLVVFAESLGARIAVSALRNISRNRQLTADKVILLSPPLGTLRQSVERLQTMSKAKGEYNRSFLYRVRSNSHDYNGYGKVKYLNEFDVLEHFFESDYLDNSLANDLLNISEIKNFLIIYGEKDERIMADKVDDLPGIDREVINISPIKGMRHQAAGLDEVNTISLAIRDFM